MGSSTNNFFLMKNKEEKNTIENNNKIIENNENNKIIIGNKINRHHTSLNLSKKNYIIKPKEKEINPNSNTIYIEDKLNTNYEKIKTFQNKKNINRNIYNNNINNNLYEPKKGLIYNNKKHLKEKSLNLNQELKSPKKLNGEKITYIKKCFINDSLYNNNGHKFNNSISKIESYINNNNNLNNLNSSFKLANELGKTYYNIGNIFNLDNNEDDNNNINMSNNLKINFNVDSLYNS